MTVFIDRCPGQAVTFDARYTSWFDFEYDSERRLMSTKEKTTVTDIFVERCGYSAIVTSDDCTADEAYALYFRCDRPAMPLFAEKAFMSEESQYSDAIHDEVGRRVIDFIAFIIW